MIMGRRTAPIGEADLQQAEVFRAVERLQSVAATAGQIRYGTRDPVEVFLNFIDNRNRSLV